MFPLASRAETDFGELLPVVLQGKFSTACQESVGIQKSTLLQYIHVEIYTYMHIHTVIYIFRIYTPCSPNKGGSKSARLAPGLRPPPPRQGRPR